MDIITSFISQITPQDIAAIGFLVFLEGVLSLDNALVMAVIVSHLPADQRKKALTYGIWGAIIFRVIAISFAAYLMQWIWVKFIGGAYLLYLAYDYWRKKREETADFEKKARVAGFWHTVILVEMADIAFAIDSILTAVALTTKLHVVITGGVIGLTMMRFAAFVFTGLLQKYPRFEATAYILVAIVGVKLILEGFQLPWIDFHHVTHPAFWCFWVTMLVALFYGFTRKATKA